MAACADDGEDVLPDEPTTHFDQGATWSVPASPGLATGFFNTAGFASNWSWTTFDIDGDHEPDLVWTADPSQSETKSVWGGAAGPHWKVFLNTGAGFAPDAITWSVPASPGLATGFFNTAGFASNWSWTTFDIDGDHKPDLVWTADPSQSETKSVWGGAAGPYWKVFLNTGAGFAPDAITWSVPASPGLVSGFFNTAGFASNWSWTTFDIDGDHKPDLVWTADPSQSETKSVWGGAAGPYWKVFLNTGAGFAPDAITWSVPQSPGLVSGFFNTAGFGSNWSWSTIDLDTDGKPDLVWTADPSQSETKSVWGGAASPQWKVFHNTGTGFAAEATTWAMPASPGVPTGFFNTDGFASNWSWTTLDLDGDRRPDFVWTADPSQSETKSVWSDASGPYWRVFRGAP